MNHINLLQNRNLIYVEKYKKFILSRPIREVKRSKGFELHHIVPKAYGGTNEKENLILLSPREHFIAHLLLWKAYGGKMAYAFWILSNKINISNNFLSSRSYERIRLEISRIRSTFRYSEQSKNKMSESASKRIRKPHSEETKKKIGQANKNKESWHRGKKKSEEVKKRMSEAQKGHFVSSETKEKYRNSHLGKKLSEEQKKKISESGKIAWKRRKEQN